jgi:hypothetical protein
MKLEKLILFVIVPNLLLYWTCTIGGFDYNKELTDYPWEESINHSTHCGPANVRMWAIWDKGEKAASQGTIASWIGSLPTDINTIANAIQNFTNSMAWPYQVSVSNEDETLLIFSRAREALEYKLPSIFIINYGVHSITLVGCQGDYENYQLVAKILYFKDPNNPMSDDYPDAYSKEEFFLYWQSGEVREVVIGIARFGSAVQGNPREELADFYRYNGTYYGGPASYIPTGSQFVRVSYPIGSEKLELGAQKNIEWESNGLTGNIKVELLKGGTYWGTIATGLPITQGSYSWAVGQYQGGTATVGDDYKIKITMMDGSDYDTSNVDFSITPQLPDVIITNVSISPTAPTPGSAVTVKATIKNQGLVDTPSGVFVGTGFNVDGNYLGAFFVKDANGNKTNLAAGASFAGSCTTLWTASAGTHTFLAKADDVDRFAESNEDNNTLEKSYSISNALPDVIIEDIWLEPPASGSSYKVHARIKNKGSAATPSGVYVGVGFKVDGTYLGAFFVKDANGNKVPLAAGASFNGICTTQWTKVAGTHSFWAMADDADRFDESNENNNTRTESIAVQ